MCKPWMWFLAFSSMAVVACHGDGDDAADTAKPRATARQPVVPQIPPPIDLQKPPADAGKTASGLVYTRLVANAAGARPGPSQTVWIRYTGWRQRTGETFFTTTGREQPIAIDLGHAAAGFRETLSLLHKGEKAVLWLPPGDGTMEPVVYEIELVDVVVPPGTGRSA